MLADDTPDFLVSQFLHFIVGGNTANAPFRGFAVMYPARFFRKLFTDVVGVLLDMTVDFVNYLTDDFAGGTLVADLRDLPILTRGAIGAFGLRSPHTGQTTHQPPPARHKRTHF